MNCLDVMAQTFPYQRYHAHTKKYDLARMHEPSPGSYDPPLPVTSVDERYSRRSPPSRPLTTIKQEDPDREQPKETHYLTANCVLFTYFSGDISQVVDDHFTRALSQTSSYSPGQDGSELDKKKEVSPMTQRNFPASFWNSHPHHHHPLPSTSHHDLPFTEPCSSFQLQDPWHYYPLSSANYSTRTMHDFSSYASMSSSRFNTAASHYKSALFMQPRTGRFASSASCDLNKPTEAWAARYHADIGPEFAAPHIDTSHVTGLEAVPATSHDPAKDLYWF